MEKQAYLINLQYDFSLTRCTVQMHSLTEIHGSWLNKKHVFILNYCIHINVKNLDSC